MRAGRSSKKSGLLEGRVDWGVRDSAVMVAMTARRVGVETRSLKAVWRSWETVMPDCMVAVYWGFQWALQIVWMSCSRWLRARMGLVGRLERRRFRGPEPRPAQPHMSIVWLRTPLETGGLPGLSLTRDQDAAGRVSSCRGPLE